MSEKILEVKNLNVVLDGEEVIKDLSFEVFKGEVLTILGPNGAGKTVLIKTLLGLIDFQGEINYLKEMKIGYVPQRLPYLKELPITVKEFFFLKERKIEKILKIFNYLNISEDNLKKRIGNLSSGQYQKILIAFALLNDPDILFFDEPTTGVDLSSEETIYYYLKKINEDLKTTIILITHDLSVVYKFSNRVICLNKKMLCYGSPIEVLDKKTLEKLYGQEIRFYLHS